MQVERDARTGHHDDVKTNLLARDRRECPTIHRVGRLNVAVALLVEGQCGNVGGHVSTR